MKFTARAPREGINVSKQHPLAEAATLIFGLSTILIAISVAAIFFVDLILLFVSPSTETKLFQHMVSEEILSADYDSSPASALQRQVDQLAEAWPDNPYEFRVGIVDDGQPNALALPGGVILITSALLGQAETENELAFVLGHEIGHFSNRDHIRQLGRVALLTLLATALLGQNADTLPSSVINATIRSFSRGQETDADLFGLQLVQKTYGHVNQSWRFFERMTDLENELGIFAAFAATHPSASNRISKLQKTAEENSWPLTGPTVPLDRLN
jgi:predicted Zn-dependent protease